jgi:hypothetical protein
LCETIAKKQENDMLDIVGLIASGTAILLLGWTGWQTHLMRNAAQDQAIAAQLILEEVRTQALLDSRPILIPAGRGDGSNFQISTTGRIVELPLRNIGRGPAFQVNVIEEIGEEWHYIDDGAVQVAVIEVGESEIITLPLNSIRTVPDCQNTEEFAQRLAEYSGGSIRLVLEYRDVFSATWRSYLALEARGPSKLHLNFLHSDGEKSRQTA